MIITLAFLEIQLQVKGVKQGTYTHPQANIAGTTRNHIYIGVEPFLGGMGLYPEPPPKYRGREYHSAPSPPPPPVTM